MLSSCKATQWLMPCDTQDFLNVYPRIRHDKTFVVIVALLKEPSATACFVNRALELPSEYSVDELEEVLFEMLDDLRSFTETHRKELEALNRQGVGRFLGVASTCREVLGIIQCMAGPSAQKRQAAGEADQEQEKRQRSTQKRGVKRERSPVPSRRATGPRTTAGTPQEKIWKLGLTGREYQRTGCKQQVGDSLEATREFRQPPEIVDTATFKEVVMWAEDFDELLTKKCPAWAKMFPYTHDFLRRKLVLGQFIHSSHRSKLQWEEIPVDMLKRMAPDQGDYLSSLPARWSCADVSRWCFERDDWGPFVSMFACLWGEVVKSYSQHRQGLIALARSEEFREAAQEYVKNHGCAAHVYTLVKQFGPVGTWPKES